MLPSFKTLTKMKKQIRVASKIFVGLTALLAIAAFSPVPAHLLKVTVAGVRSADGYVHVLLYNNATGYPQNPAMAYKHMKVKAAKGQVAVGVESLPAGSYSIVAFHDQNSNNEFDKSWFGSPREDYGFSNVPGEFCGTPSFQQTSFQLGEGEQTVSVKLISVK